MLLLKIILFVNVSHYGFALAMPAILLMVILLLYSLPRMLSNRGDNEIFFRILATLIVSSILIAHVTRAKEFYDSKTYAVGTSRDSFYTFNTELSVKGLALNMAIKKVESLILL